MTETLPPVRTTHTFATPAGSWCYDTWGVHGRPAVLLAAALFDRTTWWPVAADLRPHATVVAVDLPGHGGSTTHGHYDADALVDDLACLIDSLRLRRAPVIVGHGSSALLAMLFADRYATHAVVTVDPTPPAVLAAGVDAYLHTMGLDAIPEQYRGLVEASRDTHLLDAYAASLGRVTAMTGTNTTGLVVHSRAPDEPRDTPPTSPRWRYRTYDVPGRFAHLTAEHRFVSDLHTLL
ncbi:hypothetical protein Aca07nite_64470 [Actinoplanes capillaceus]|uniref:AB hydrolase-1 domain-containing protein n=1 Tax=Actinoplanes campanulatus TaxID=113559 RepID=A0ABQ3WSI3_9ACTN|nr:alpha/beta hydrolase [Actinoplanes capillaceus]GID49172.1 hypothetical protein Aca07nite_64470 [Actinoplanes capillaceus]